MNIAILGTGNIGSTLGAKWGAAGHTIYFGSRDPQKPELQTLIKGIGDNAHATTFAQAIAPADVILFAVPGNAMDEMITANARILDGKILIDAANKITSPVMNSFSTFNTHTPTAKIYRAFNNYGWENFENAEFGSDTADLFYCGTDWAASLTSIEQLIKDVGLNPVYLGGPEQVPVVDSILRLWFALSSAQKKGRHLAFKMLV